MKTAGEILKDKNRDMVCISFDKTVRDAVQLMNDNNIGAILVKKNDQIVVRYK